MAIVIGTSGYAHLDWRGRFYSKDLPQSAWLAFYARTFSTVEIANTYYELPASPIFRHWDERTPKNFQFFLKGSREITDLKRLRNCHTELASFFERASELGEKWAGILWQLPLKFPHDPDLLRSFLEELERVQLIYGRVRQVFEFRDLSWFEGSIYRILSTSGAAVALSDWPFALSLAPKVSVAMIEHQHGTIRPQISLPQTTNWIYARFHGPAGNVASGYGPQELERFANRLRPFIRESDSFVYFANATQGWAIDNATDFARLVGNEI